MPLELIFSPKKSNISKDSVEADNLVTAILQSPFLNYVGANADITLDGNYIKSIKLTVKGITVTDDESSRWLAHMIHQRLNEVDSPFFLSRHSTYSQAQPDESLFMHERFKPIKSKNARALAQIENLQIPERFCCPLSGDIMDDPIFDIRSPTIIYDNDFLIYWVKKSQNRAMPHTKLTYTEDYMRCDYDLKNEINSFIKSQIEMAQKKILDEVLKELKCDNEFDKNRLNRALLTLSESEVHDSIASVYKLKILFKSGADVNCQWSDTGDTPLHLACKNQTKTEYIIALLYAGAKINIPNLEKMTAYNLNQNSPNFIAKEKFINVCGMLNLPTTTSNNESVKKVERAAPKIIAQFSAPLMFIGDSYDLLVRQINRLLEKDDKRSDLAAFEQSIKERNYTQAIRRACTSLNLQRILPLLEIVLSFQNKLNFDINEAKGAEKRTALHYAAIKIATHKNNCLYELLIKHGAKDDLPDAKGITAKEYLKDSLNSSNRPF